MPTDMCALEDFDEPDKLHIQIDDVITIIEGRWVCFTASSVMLSFQLFEFSMFHSEILSIRAENYWWRGQNKRTLKVGQFPRNVVTAVAGLSAHDISRPLKNSFIHTGHGDSNPRRCWGFPDRIDE